MATFTGTNIPINAHADARINRIVDTLLTPRLVEFRQITVYDEQLALQIDGVTWKATYGNWLQAFTMRLHLNSQLSNHYNYVDYVNGTLETGIVSKGPDGRPYDVVNLTYQFDYFPVNVLAGFIQQACWTVNTWPAGSPTDVTIDNAPDYWDGVMADLAFVMCMERLILDYDMWHGRLVFALGPGQVEESGGDIVAQLETLKTNAEERAAKTLDNEKFKVPNCLALPTQYYYNAVRGVGGHMTGPHGTPSYGKIRGLMLNRVY